MRSKEEILTLAAEVREELKHLPLLTEQIDFEWRRMSSVPPADQPAFLGSAALNLHNFYTVCERIFERIAADINGGVPGTQDWHTRLVRSMAMEVPQVRPAVLSAALVRELEEYLKFRNLVRNIYAFQLEQEKMRPLVEGLKSLRSRFRQEVDEFLLYLETLASSLGR